MAKSWRYFQQKVGFDNKLYATLHDIFTSKRIENTDVFDDKGDDDQSAIDNLLMMKLRKNWKWLF